MRTWRMVLGAILVFALARPALAQFSTSMAATTGGASSATSSPYTKSSFFNQLFGTNMLSSFPSAPRIYGTMAGRNPTGTMPQMLIINPPPRMPQNGGSSWFGGLWKKSGN